MSAQGRLANRHPDVLLITHNEEEVHGVVEVIDEQFESFRCLIKTESVLEDIKQLRPKVLLFALANIKHSITLYTLIIKSKILDENHYSVLLCNNKESGLAFGSCLRDLFNSYFVYQPLYEKFRLKLIIYEGLTRCHAEQNFQNSLLNVVKQQDKELSELIELGATYKTQILDTIDKSKEQVERIAEKMANDEQGDVKQELMKKINTEHLQPLFSLLESAISDNLMEIVQKLMVSQQDLNACTLTLPSIEESKLNLLSEQRIETKPKIIEQESDVEKRILVVEDNHIYREMISDVLTSDKYKVDQVDDGLRAVKKIKTDAYHLIIMDLFMPQLDGLNTTKHIRHVGKNKKTPVIALSGNKNKSIVKKWASHGLAGYIVKPSTKAEILNVVKQVLEKNNL